MTNLAGWTREPAALVVRPTVMGIRLFSGTAVLVAVIAAGGLTAGCTGTGDAASPPKIGVTTPSDTSASSPSTDPSADPSGAASAPAGSDPAPSDPGEGRSDQIGPYRRSDGNRDRRIRR